MREAMGDGPNTGSYNQWADAKKSAIQFNYDADLDAEQWWTEYGAEAEGTKPMDGPGGAPVAILI